MTNNIKIKGLKFILTFFLLITIFFVTAGCGLPQYESIEKPIALSQNGNIVSFQTPSSINNIIGYEIYYKIYDIVETDLITSDEALFNADNYDSDQGESIPTGNTLLTANDFISMTKSGNNLFLDPLYQDTISSNILQIDFTDFSENPKLLLNYSSVATMELKRGSKGSTTDDVNDSGVEFLSFITDYDFTSPQIDNDLTDMLSRLTPSTPTNNIRISVCVYSVGLDLTTMSQLESQPVFLGTLDYDSFYSTKSHD